MSYRFMRMMVFFDLPTLTVENRRSYNRFRKLLVQNGFLMLQESVYCRMVLNGTVERSVADLIRRERPPEGMVMLLTVTEKQFAGMDIITGEYSTDVIDTDERTVFL